MAWPIDVLWRYVPREVKLVTHPAHFPMTLHYTVNGDLCVASFSSEVFYWPRGQLVACVALRGSLVVGGSTARTSTLSKDASGLPLAFTRSFSNLRGSALSFRSWLQKWLL